MVPALRRTRGFEICITKQRGPARDGSWRRQGRDTERLAPIAAMCQRPVRMIRRVLPQIDDDRFCPTTGNHADLM